MGAIIGLWPPEAGRYPLAAYTAAFGTVVVLQMLALLPLATLREVGPR
jgi:hypothetical protein